MKVQIMDAIEIGPKICKIELQKFGDKLNIITNKMTLKTCKDNIFINSKLERKQPNPKNKRRKSEKKTTRVAIRNFSQMAKNGGEIIKKRS